MAWHNNNWVSWIKDPLWFFLLAGAAIFAAAQWLAQDDIPYDITVSAADTQRLQDQWQLQMRRQPTPQELSGLVEQFVKEEIYYREAQRLGLDANDTIVRRRMVQKLTFLTEDIATAAPLDADALSRFYEDNRDNYRLPERFTFRHRYFSVDRRSNARADAEAALTNPAERGDPFMLQKSYAQRSVREIGDLFGREFATSLSRLTPEDTWQGPIRSAYGWHAVLLSDRIPAQLQPFEQVRERVAADQQQATRTAANAAYYAALKRRYRIAYPTDASE